jgi:hypothetical protein
VLAYASLCCTDQTSKVGRAAAALLLVKATHSCSGNLLQRGMKMPSKAASTADDTEPEDKERSLTVPAHDNELGQALPAK